MTAVDTNILVYAHRDEFAAHRRARDLLLKMADGHDLWAIPVFCLTEFLRVVTHPLILRPPTPLRTALDVLGLLLESPSLRVLTPGERFPQLLIETAREARAKGNLAFDAQIVALCREHGVRTFLSNDRDLAKFSGMETRPI